MLKIFKKFSILSLLITHFGITAVHIPNADVPYRVVFIHLGKNLPSYVPIALSQARSFCPTAEIILIINREFFENEQLQELATVIYTEEIQKTPEHEYFITTSRLDKEFREGFWYYTTERLLYLDDLISQYDLKNTFHLENDNLIYVDLEELLFVFTNNYPGIAVPFESDTRGFANFMFVANKHSIHALACHLSHHADSGQSEMMLINTFKMAFGHNYIDHLPTIMKEYADDHVLTSASGTRCTVDPIHFFKNIEDFRSLFDGCAYGQYFGGVDPRNGPEGAGFINQEAIFNVSLMNFIWQADVLGRVIPYAIYRDRKFRINNLHVHSKNLKRLATVDLDEKIFFK